MRPRKYNQTLLNKVKRMHLSGCNGVFISKQLNIPTSSISHFKRADFCLETYLANQKSNTKFYNKCKST